MAWTPAEIDEVRAAIHALATGKRVVSITYAGPPQRSVTYGAADLATLRSLLESMEGSVPRTSTRMRRVVFSKGFGPPPGEE